jgi:hypothetical protein
LIFSTDQSSMGDESRPPGVSRKIESSSVTISPRAACSFVMPRG